MATAPSAIPLIKALIQRDFVIGTPPPAPSIGARMDEWPTPSANTDT